MTERLKQLGDCELVVEAIVERLGQAGIAAPAGNIVAPELILASKPCRCRSPPSPPPASGQQQVAGFHFFNPVPLMRVVEVVDSLASAPRSATPCSPSLRAWATAIVRTKDSPGFIVNHAGRAYGTEACASSAKASPNAPRSPIVCCVSAPASAWGRIELLDLTGLDVSHPVMESIYQQYYQERATARTADRQVEPPAVSGARASQGLLSARRRPAAGQARPQPVPECRR